MTKQKKHKKRVRARMEETGETYTEANATLDDETTPKTGEPLAAHTEIEETVKELLEARKIGAFTVATVLQKFHRKHHEGQGEWVATLGSHAMDHLWPGGKNDPADEDGLRDLLKNYRKDSEFPGAGVHSRSEAHKNAFGKYVGAIRKHHKMPPMDWTPEPGNEDDAWYDSSRPFQELGPGQLEGFSDQQVLEGMWQYAPDVSSVFGIGMPKQYGWDRYGRDQVPNEDGNTIVIKHPLHGRIEITASAEETAHVIAQSMESVLPQEAMKKTAVPHVRTGPFDPMEGIDHPGKAWTALRDYEHATPEERREIENTVNIVGLGTIPDVESAFIKEMDETLGKKHQEELLRRQQDAQEPVVITADDGGPPYEHQPSPATVKVLDTEIQRLRKKLEEAGIDPDA